MGAIPPLNDPDLAYASDFREILDLYTPSLYSNPAPPKPPTLHYDAALASELSDVPPLDGYSEKDESFIKFVRDFYRKNGYLPHCPDQDDEARTLAIRRFKAEDPSMWPCIERCARLANVSFKAPTLVVLIYSQALIVVASVDHPTQPGEVLVYNHILCSHAISGPDGSAVHIPNLHQDWRFSNMPGISASFIGQPFSLPLHNSLESGLSDGKSIPVGVLCILGDHAKPLSDESRIILSDLGAMITDQIQLTWQQARCAKEEKMRLFIQDLLAKAIVQNSPEQTPRFHSRDTIIHKLVSRQLRSVLESDFACIVDLSAFHPAWTAGDFLRSGSEASFGWVDDGSKTGRVVRGRLDLLGWDTSARCDASKFKPESIFSSQSAVEAVRVYLKDCFQSPILKFPIDGPLKVLLPKETQAYVAIPLFNGVHPTLLAIVATQTPFCPYELSDVSFTSNIAVVCLGALIQQRVIEADAAKTTFVTMISHELRTPLHGLLSQLELIREYASSNTVQEIGPFLETAECCGLGLKDILNDVLDFGKMDTVIQSPKDHDEAQRTHSVVDLALLAKETLATSYLRRRQYYSVSHSEKKSQPSDDVEVSLLIEECLNGWSASVDVAGLRRVLTNIASNALKYTSSGSISLELRELETPKTKHALEEGCRMIGFTMRDTGVGMSTEFQNNLFTPFSQENIFNPGSGLGLSICQKIVKRMDGTILIESKLGVGTVVTISLPAKLSNPRPLRTDQDSRHFNIEILSNASPRIPFSPVLPILREFPLISTVSADGAKTVVAEKEHIRVLVVDDNEIGRKILTTVLRRRGVAFEEAADGQQAVEVFRRYRPHLVWTDVSMPIMNGVDAAKAMRQIELEDNRLPRCRIVAITGMTSNDLLSLFEKQDDTEENILDEWLVKGQTNLKALTLGLENLQSSLRMK